MSSASKRMKINTRERAVSADVNRLQAFLAGASAETARFALLAVLSDASAGGIATVPSTQTAPLTAVVLNGFCAKPQPASTDMFVDQGVAWMLDPTGDSGDDSSVKLVVDGGNSTPGALSFTSNVGGGAIRIDVIECQRVEAVIETSSRDIYNATTGAYAAATVDKVVKATMTYRIRLGTPGAGFPGTAAGWMPLAVASVPDAAVNWDVCTFWDVRPLMVDQPCWSILKHARPIMRVFNGTAGFEYDDNTGVAANRKFINGILEWEYGGRIVGGMLPAAGLDLSTNDFAEAGFIAGVAANSMWHLYAAFPSGLPRWCRYVLVGGALVPGAFRGVAIASSVNTSGFKREPSVALSMPTNTGLGGTTSVAVAVWSSYSDNALKLLPASSNSDGWIQLARSNTKLGPAATNGGFIVANTLFRFDIVEGTNVPHGVKEIEVEVTITWTTGGVVSKPLIMQLQVEQESFATTNFDTNRIQQGPQQVNFVVTAGVEVASGIVHGRLSLPPSYPGPTAVWAARTWRCAALAKIAGDNAALTASGTATVVITGFRL